MHFKSTQIANGNEEKEDRPFKIIINFIQASSDSLTAYQFIVAASFSPIMIVGGMALWRCSALQSILWEPCHTKASLSDEVHVPNIYTAQVVPNDICFLAAVETWAVLVLQIKTSYQSMLYHAISEVTVPVPVVMETNNCKPLRDRIYDGQSEVKFQ